MTFEAEWVTECDRCPEDIEPGQICEYVNSRGGRARYRHVICPEPKPEVPLEVCPVCFMKLLPSLRCPSCE